MTNPPPSTSPGLPPGTLVAGIDTHKDTHHVAILDHIGRAVLDRQFMATPDGYRKVVDFLHSAGTVERLASRGPGPMAPASPAF
ncbi:IS110 family transposase [Arthrobacter sp. AOP36-C1-22]|uniref:IS110 family transposase n=1 Tax=Arthrobacter sp. AOP36-C1-22 TaxID=3457683 RepID=UPI004033CCA9